MAKIDMSEVKVLKEDLVSKAEGVTTSIATTKTSLNRIKDMRSFDGVAAKATKSYISDAHNNLIEVYDNLITELKENFNYSIEQFTSSVDNDANCIITSDYITKIQTDIKSSATKITTPIKSINKEIASLSDITSASSITVGEFKNNNENFKKITTNLLEKFEAFVSSSQREVAQSKEFMNILSSMQGQVQTISTVPNGISSFSKNNVAKFKEWKSQVTAIRSAAKNAKKIDGTVHFLYNLSKGHIQVSYTKNGKLSMRIVSSKAIVKDFTQIKKNGPIFKRYKFTSEWRIGTTHKKLTTNAGKLNKLGEKYTGYWGLDKVFTEVSKKTVSQRLKGALASPFTGWKDLSKFGKGMKALGIAGTVAETGLSGYENYNDATKQGIAGNKRVVSTTVNTGIDMGVSIGGAVAGAKAGAVTGALLGSIFPGPGNAIGAAVGGIIGAAAGSWAASEASKKIRNGLKKNVNNVLKNGIGKSIQKLGSWAFG